MKVEAIVCLVLVVLLLVSVFCRAAMQLPGCRGAGSHQSINIVQPQTIEHKITDGELQLLRSGIEIEEESQNHNQIVGGHGTGLAPPSEANWGKIGDETYVVDQVLSTTSLPSNVDNSATPWFPPIGNQGLQGSCATWAVGYYMKTFQEAKEHGWNLSDATPDEIMSPSFLFNLINSGVDNGSSFYDAIQLVCTVGDCSLAKMPYNAADCTSWPSEEAWREAAFYRGNYSGYEELQLTKDAGLANLKNWIASDNLAVITVDANQYVNLSSNDVWTTSNYVNPSIDHVNTIVGYDDSIQYVEEGQLRQGAFKIANSWGVGWPGDHNSDGFYWISYKAMEQRVQSCVFYSDKVGYVPTLTASFRIQHPMRGECNIMIGMGTHDNPTVSKNFTEYIHGGNQPFCYNNIVFDITEFEDAVPNIYGNLFFLSVCDGGSPAIGTILYFSVENTVSPNPPVTTVNGNYVFADLTLENASACEVCLSVEPIAVAPLTDIDSSINDLETPPTSSPVGQDFTVQIHLRNATLANVPSGVAGVEVHFNFSAILPYAQLVNYTEMLGQPGGALGPSILYRLDAGFYDDADRPIAAPPYTNATQYEVAADSMTGAWNGDDGLVAIMCFKVKSQPSFIQLDFTAPLYITWADLSDTDANRLPYGIAQGGLRIDAQLAPTYFSVEPIAVSPLTNTNASVNGLETPLTPSPAGQYFRVGIHLRNATLANVPSGVAGVEVHFYFGNILNYCRPIGFTDMLGQPGGVFLWPPTSLIYGTSAGFYDDAGHLISNSSYTNATQYEVATASMIGTWNNADGLVAEITFQITNQPLSPQSDFYAPLKITYTDMTDEYANRIPFYVISGSLRIDKAPPFHDLAVTGVLSLKTVIGQGYEGKITVTASNFGAYTETSSVTVYANTTIIASQNVTLSAGDSRIITFTWNTTGFALCNYAVNAYAWPVSNETNTADNNFTGGPVTVTVPGDINGDFNVKLADLVLLANAYGSHPNDQKWNPNADINGNDAVELSDLVLLALHYGQHHP